MGRMITGRPGRQRITYKTRKGLTTYNQGTRKYSGPGTKPKGAKTEQPSRGSVTVKRSGAVVSEGFEDPGSERRAKRKVRRARRAVRRSNRRLAAGRAAKRRSEQRRREDRPKPRTRKPTAVLESGEKVRRPLEKLDSLPPRKLKRPAKKFLGKPVAGEQPLGELARAADKGALRVNERGYVTTPTLRKAKRRLNKAERSAPKASHDVGGIEDPEIRRAIVKHAPRVERLARERYGISGEALLSKVIEGESSEDHDAVSTADAKSITQFIPSTREDFVKRFGIDPWRSKEEAVLAATMHLDGKHGYTAGLEGYNPGGGEAYVRYILDQPVGHRAGQGRKVTPQLRQARRLARKEGLKVRPKGKGKPKLGELTGEDLSTSSPAIKRLGRVIAGRVGSPLEIISAARPGSTTTSGNVSDHSTGNAIDIHALSTRYGSEADQEHGNRIAYEAVIAAGGSKAQAQAMAENGGALSVVNDQGVRTQIIWRSDIGGDHHNHVHVGVSGAVGSGGFKAGFGSFVGGLPQGAVASIGEATGMSAAQLNEAVAADPRLADKLLRKAGFRVSKTEKAKRIFRRLEQVGAGVGPDSEPEPEEEGNALLSELERKYDVGAV